MVNISYDSGDPDLQRLTGKKRNVYMRRKAYREFMCHVNMLNTLLNNELQPDVMISAFPVSGKRVKINAPPV